MKRNQGVPQIESEIQIALALLQWTPKMFAEYSEVIGHPVPVGVVEESLSIPMDRFGVAAQAGVMDNICRTFASLGLGFATHVFGVVLRDFSMRVPLTESCTSMAAVVGQLFKTIPKAQVTIAIQRSEAVTSMPCALSLVMETPFGNRLLFDTPPPAENDAEEILTLAYAIDLTRVSVATRCIDQTAGLSPDDAVATILCADLKAAASVPRSRMLEMLEGAD